LWVRTDRVADAAALMVAPLAWEGPNGVELVRALAWIQQAGGMGVAHRIRRWLGARWLQADAGWHLAEARHLREHGDWDGAVGAARHAVRLSSDAQAILELVDGLRHHDAEKAAALLSALVSLGP